MDLKWTHTRKKVILEDGKTATRDTYLAKGRKNEYLFVKNYYKGEYWHSFTDVLFVNGKIKYKYVSGFDTEDINPDVQKIEKTQLARAKANAIKKATKSPTKKKVVAKKK